MVAGLGEAHLAHPPYQRGAGTMWLSLAHAHTSKLLEPGSVAQEEGCNGSDFSCKETDCVSSQVRKETVLRNGEFSKQQTKNKTKKNPFWNLLVFFIYILIYIFTRTYEIIYIFHIYTMYIHTHTVHTSEFHLIKPISN